MPERKVFASYSVCATVFMGILYILLPSINPSGDTYTFANQIKSGTELFLPHHLIYNAFYFVLAKLFSISNMLGFISLMNSLFAVGCLFFLNAIFSKYINENTRALLIIFLGSCYGFMRYATTGETYIVPLFFSLWASWSAISRQRIFIIALIAGIACLFHQVHIFWWLGLFIFSVIAYPGRTTINFIQYSIGSCIIPLVYFIVFYTTKHDCSTIFEYIAHDYIYQENVEFSFKAKSLLLTPISFIRTFYQIHGYFLPLLQKFWIGGIGIIISVALGIIGLLKLKQTKKRKNNNELFSKQFANCHLLIFFLQLLFASVSDGNAEFMVMLPFALSLFIFIRYQFQRLPLYTFSLSILIWNVSLGLIPYHFLEVTPEPALARYIEKNPKEIYYIKDRQTVRQYLDYYYPEQTFHLYSAILDSKNLDFLLQKNESMLTDLLSPRNFSRSSIAGESSNQISSYNIEIQDSISYDLGVLVIARISK